MSRDARRFESSSLSCTASGSLSIEHPKFEYSFRPGRREPKTLRRVGLFLVLSFTPRSSSRCATSCYLCRTQLYVRIVGHRDFVGFRQFVHRERASTRIVSCRRLGEEFYLVRRREPDWGRPAESGDRHGCDGLRIRGNSHGDA